MGDQNLKKMYFCKTFFYIFGSKIKIYLSLGLHEGRTSYGRILQPSKTSSASKHENSLIFFYICGPFLPSWIRIQPLKLMRIDADPDPQPWNKSTSPFCKDHQLCRKQTVKKTPFLQMTNESACQRYGTLFVDLSPR